MEGNSVWVSYCDTEQYWSPVARNLIVQFFFNKESQYASKLPTFAIKVSPLIALGKGGKSDT